MPAVHERLQVLLKQKGITINRVAILAQMDRTVAYRLIGGLSRNPKIETVEAIVAALGSTMSELYEIEVDEPAEKIPRKKG